MDIQVIGSSSKGNAYLLDDGESKILLECGVPIKQIKKACDFRLSEVAGCLVSHEHKDHCKSLKDVLNTGIDCYMSKGTADAIGINHHRIKTVEARRQFQIGSWTVLPFDVEHDVAEPFGFLLSSAHKEKVLFLTDTYYCKYKFNGIHYYMVECNYSLPILEANVALGKIPKMLKSRIMKSHFSLENVLAFFQNNDLSQTKEIHLLHLSDNNSDEALFQNKVQQLTGIPTYV